MTNTDLRTEFPCPVEGCLVFAYDTEGDLLDHIATGDHLFTLRSSKVAAALNPQERLDDTTSLPTGNGEGNGHGGTSRRSSAHHADGIPATDAQVRYLVRLGKTEDEAKAYTKAEASTTIDILVKAQKAGIGTQGPELASTAQTGYITTLLAEKDHGLDTAAIARTIEEGALTRQAASAILNNLTACGRKVVAPAQGVQEGVYNHGGRFVRVYLSQRGAFITKTWDATVEEWVYTGTKALTGLTADMAIDAETARTFGLQFHSCVRCGRSLTLDESEYVGYGKTCAGKMGWWYPTKAEMKAAKAEGATV